MNGPSFAKVYHSNLEGNKRVPLVEFLDSQAKKGSYCVSSDEISLTLMVQKEEAFRLERSGLKHVRHANLRSYRDTPMTAFNSPNYRIKIA